MHFETTVNENTKATIIAGSRLDAKTVKMVETHRKQQRSMLKDWLNKEMETFQQLREICIGNSMICSDIWHKYHE